jgi:histidine phosphotransfer protein HptB
MQLSRDHAPLCYSTLAHEPDMAELVELFVQELPDRLAGLRCAAEAHDLQQVGRLAHQLKGAGGSHGFPSLTTAAAQLEHAAREFGSLPEVWVALNQLIEACANTRAGTPR